MSEVNKAAEERELTVGEILKVAEEVGISFVTDERRPDNSTIIDFALCVIAADRASRQVANVPSEIAKVLGLHEPVSVVCAVQAIKALMPVRQVANKAEVEPLLYALKQIHGYRDDVSKSIAADSMRFIAELALQDFATPVDGPGFSSAELEAQNDGYLKLVRKWAKRAEIAEARIAELEANATPAGGAREDDFAKIVRSSCGKQVLFFKGESEDDGNTLHIVMTSNDAHFDMKMKGIPDEHFKSSLDKADQKMADQALQQIKDLGFGEEE